MKLQLAIDLMTVTQAKALLDEIIDSVDIIEIGTPLIIRAGAAAVTDIKQSYPQTTVLADLKIVDAGAHEAKIGFEAGADIVTVLGVAHDVTIQGVVSQARDFGKAVMVDLIAVSDVRSRAAEIDAMGCDYICVHTGSDVQGHGHNPLAELALVHDTLQHAKLAVAGGINPSSLVEIRRYRPEIVVVGSYITGHTNRRQAAEAIKSELILEEGLDDSN